MESESNTIEITDSGNKTTAKIFAGIMLFVLVITNVGFGFISFNMPNFKDTLLVILLTHLPFSILILYLLITTYGLNTKISKILISDKTIQFIQFPKRRPSTINWHDFDTMRLKVTGFRRTALDTLVELGTIGKIGKPKGRILKTKFSRKKPNKYLRVKNHKIFSDSKTRQILNALIKNAKEHNKNIDIEHHTSKYYRLTV